MAIFVIYAFDFVNRPNISIVHEPGEEIFIKGKLVSFFAIFLPKYCTSNAPVIKASKMLLPIVSDKINNVLWIPYAMINLKLWGSKVCGHVRKKYSLVKLMLLTWCSSLCEAESRVIRTFIPFK